eukprot:s20_g42.t1
MPQYTYLQVKTLVLELFCVSRTGVADPNIAHRKRSSFYIIEEGETEDGEQGFWVVDEETGEEGFTGLYTDTEFWVLGAKGSYSRRRLHGRTFKKGRPKGYGKKGGKRSRPGFRPRSKGKGYAAAWDNDQQDTAFWQKGKGKKGKKGFMKGKDCFKGMPWKGGKGKGKDKGGKQSFPAQQQQANVAQQQPATASTQPPQTDKADLAEEGWGNYGYDWNDRSWYTSDYDVDDYGEDTSWYSWAYFASATDLPETETSAPVSYSETSATALCGTTGTDYTGSEYQHPIKFHSDYMEEHAFLNYDHGAQQSLLCEYVGLGTTKELGPDQSILVLQGRLDVEDTEVPTYRTSVTGRDVFRLALSEVRIAVFHMSSFGWRSGYQEGCERWVKFLTAAIAAQMDCITGNGNLFAQGNFKQDSHTDYKSSILVDLLERLLAEINQNRSGMNQISYNICSSIQAGAYIRAMSGDSNINADCMIMISLSYGKQSQVSLTRSDSHKAAADGVVGSAYSDEVMPTDSEKPKYLQNIDLGLKDSDQAAHSPLVSKLHCQRNLRTRSDQSDQERKDRRFGQFGRQPDYWQNERGHRGRAWEEEEEDEETDDQVGRLRSTKPSSGARYRG